MRLLIVGAGPKAIAIAAKCHVLRELGRTTPDVLILEKQEIGSSWTGRGGLTHGRHPLGTPPEKDVGFPYESEFGTPVDRAMLAYSWNAFKIDCAEYSEWIDRGKPHPIHKKWAEYLKWAAHKAGADINFGDLTRIDNRTDSWRLAFRKRNGTLDFIDGEGLVITGPGEPVRLPGEPANHPRIFNGRNFWKSLKSFGKLDPGSTIGIIGGGETAASVTVALAQQLADQEVRIFVVNRQGCSFSRGESYDENRLYSDPSDWVQIPLEARKEIIQRTDRGVFSLYSKRIIDQAENVEHLMVDVQKIKVVNGLPHITGRVGNKSREYQFSHLINATGFNPLWFADLMTEPWKGRLADKNRNRISRRIESDLSVRGIHPRLHLPMLAGLVQGAGFPNLSCLGHLSDRILSPYVSELNDKKTSKSSHFGRFMHSNTQAHYKDQGRRKIVPCWDNSCIVLKLAHICT